VLACLAAVGYTDWVRPVASPSSSLGNSHPSIPPLPQLELPQSEDWRYVPMYQEFLSSQCYVAGI
jgi:hypothetical protein